MWQCKVCKKSLSSRYELLKHFKLKHCHYGRNFRYPCVYLDCPCTFTLWKKLIVHVYRSHSTQTTQKSLKLATFSCQICACKDISSERDYFIHINDHLRQHETVSCVFDKCDFQTNIYSTFNSHKNRKHKPHTLKDFKAGVVTTTLQPQLVDSADDYPSEDIDVECDTLFNEGSDTDKVEDLPRVIEQKVAAVLLKLENIHHVSTTAIDELLDEIHFVLNSASVPVTFDIISDVLKNHNLQIDSSVIKELAAAVCKAQPLGKAIGKGGSLATGFKRKQFYKEHFCVVEPVEVVLNTKTNQTFQYIPLLQSLQQVLENTEVLKDISDFHRPNENTSVESEKQLYRSIKDGLFFKENCFFSGEDWKISLNLYIDDFEICNPLGTSRKKHKLCGVYWTLGNLPPGSHSTLTSIYLSTLCKTSDLKAYGYAEVLGPLLQDLTTLEHQGLFISKLGKFVKGTVQCVIADNLGAHGVAGFVESFSGHYICRFCTAEKSEINSKNVLTGAFEHRNKEQHDSHVKSAQENGTSCFGVKRACIFTEHLTHFHVTRGYPPDIVHDLFEGIVPHELALCLQLLISKKYFSLDSLNTLIQKFPYKWSDKTNRPHSIPRTYASKKTIGGNAHENWALLRLLPFMVGELIPDGESAWLVILDLKDIVELTVAPVQSTETIAYLNSKISEHRDRLLELFPDIKLLPKHHFVEHYPQMIKNFGPLVSLWTMRFEAKHSFFKQVARHTSCFKNIALTLASKHQQMIAYHIRSPGLKKNTIEVTHVSTVPVDILNQQVASTLRQDNPGITEVHLSKSVTFRGIRYRNGMIVAYGSAGGLPEFAEVTQMCIIQDKLSFIVKVLCAWYREHFRAFALTSSPSREVALVTLEQLTDAYPLADYMVAGMRMVTFKRHIITTGLII